MTGARGRSPDADGASAAELIDRYISAHAGWRGETLAAIRRIFHEADPGVAEEWKWMGSPVWSHDGVLAVANAHRDKVKLTFNDGARLPDPSGVFNAGLGGGKWRAVDISEGDEVDEAALGALVRAAVELNATRAASRRRSPARGARTTT